MKYNATLPALPMPPAVVVQIDIVTVKHIEQQIPRVANDFPKFLDPYPAFL